MLHEEGLQVSFNTIYFSNKRDVVSRLIHSNKTLQNRESSKILCQINVKALAGHWNETVNPQYFNEKVSILKKLTSYLHWPSNICGYTTAKVTQAIQKRHYVPVTSFKCSVLPVNQAWETWDWRESWNTEWADQTESRHLWFINFY